MCHDGCGFCTKKNKRSEKIFSCPATEDGRALEKCDNLCNDPMLWVNVEDRPLKD